MTGDRRRRLRTYTVLHVDTERGWRGGERQTLWLAVELERRGHRSIIVARPGEPLAVRAASAGLTVIDCAPRFEADPLAALRLRRAIRMQRADVVHAHTAHAAAIGALATLGTRVPLIAARRVDFRLRHNPGTRFKYGRAAFVVAVSEAVARIVAEGPVDRDRIAVVPDATDVHRCVEPASPETLRALGVRDGAPLVVQVAQLVGHKDPLNFVRAMDVVRRRVPSAQGMLVGDGALRGDVEREVAALGLQETVIVAGYRTDADSLLAAASVACLGSKEEGMGSVLLDALMLGKPIAATVAGGIPEVVEDGVTGLLAPIRDPGALGEAIARLLTDRALAERLAGAAHARAGDFSVERMTDRTLAVYARAATG